VSWSSESPFVLSECDRHRRSNDRHFDVGDHLPIRVVDPQVMTVLSRAVLVSEHDRPVSPPAVMPGGGESGPPRIVADLMHLVAAFRPASLLELIGSSSPQSSTKH
jgi:hypothetical protein